MPYVVSEPEVSLVDKPSFIGERFPYRETVSLHNEWSGLKTAEQYEE